VCGGQGCGVVFQLDPNGDETTLYSVEGPPGDGEGPESNLLRGKDGVSTARPFLAAVSETERRSKLTRTARKPYFAILTGQDHQPVRCLLRTSKEVSTESPALSTTPGRCTCWTRRETKPYSINSQRRRTAALQPERCFAIKPAISTVLRNSAATRTRFAAARLLAAAWCLRWIRRATKRSSTRLPAWRTETIPRPASFRKGAYELYGTAQNGGNLNCLQGPCYGCGTIFKLTLPAGTAFDPQ
jgi:hypothetical protein